MANVFFRQNKMDVAQSLYQQVKDHPDIFSFFGGGGERGDSSLCTEEVWYPNLANTHRGRGASIFD